MTISVIIPVYFIDSDDYIPEHAFTNMVSYLKDLFLGLV